MRKHFQFILLFIQTFIIRHKKYLALGGIIGFFTTLFLVSTYPFYAELITKRHTKIGIIGRFTERNLPLFIQNQISLGLTALTPSGEATPSLARFWEVDANNTTYTFYLHPDIYWHDGKHFIAKDIDYKLQGATFESINDLTLKVTLKEPYAPLPTILSPPILKQNLVGLGIYKVARVKYAGEAISELTLTSQKTSLPLLAYKFYPTVDGAILAFKRGEINIIQDMSSFGDLNKWKNIKILETTSYDRFVGIFFNLNNPLFKEKVVRQALTYATSTSEGVEKVYSPISPLSWAYSQKIRLYRYDPEAAKKILSKNPISSPSTQLTLTTYVSLLETAQAIADAWNKIGVDVKVKVETSLPTNYQVLLATQTIPPDPDQYQYWQSTQNVANLTHYSNLKIDKLLEDGRKTSDKEARKKIYADFQRYLVDDAPAIFLYHPKVYTIERK